MHIREDVQKVKSISDTFPQITNITEYPTTFLKSYAIFFLHFGHVVFARDTKVTQFLNLENFSHITL